MTQPLLHRSVDAWLRVPQLVRWCVPVAGMCALWWSSSRTPSDGLPRLGGPLVHNAMHVVAYACIAGSAWLAWSRRPAHGPHRLRTIGAWLVAAAYGVVDELHQSWVPGRDCSLFDLVSDASGAALAVLLLGGAVGGSRRWRAGAMLATCGALVGVLAATYAG